MAKWLLLSLGLLGRTLGETPAELSTDADDAVAANAQFVAAFNAGNAAACAALYTDSAVIFYNLHYKSPQRGMYSGSEIEAYWEGLIQEGYAAMTITWSTVTVMNDNTVMVDVATNWTVSNGYGFTSRVWERDTNGDMKIKLSYLDLTLVSTPVPTPVPTTITDAALAANGELLAFFKAGNIAECAAFYEDDAVVYGGTIGNFYGKTQILNYYTLLSAAGIKGATFTTTGTSVTGNTVLVSASWKKKQGILVTKGTVSRVWNMGADGSMLVSVEHFKVTVSLSR